MINIKLAQEADIDVLALLGRTTFAESHGHYIDNKNDLSKFLDENFSTSKIKQDINNTKNLFYIIYKDDLAMGYAKLVLNPAQKSVLSENNCQLERIYILSDFIPLKIGQQFLTFVIAQAKIFKLDTMWLSVYEKNYRAIRFYERNEFKKVGELNFLVNGTKYANQVFAKKL